MAPSVLLFQLPPCQDGGVSASPRYTWKSSGGLGFAVYRFKIFGRESGNWLQGTGSVDGNKFTGYLICHPILFDSSCGRRFDLAMFRCNSDTTCAYNSIYDFGANGGTYGITVSATNLAITDITKE
jgi:hypothetical protein